MRGLIFCFLFLSGCLTAAAAEEPSNDAVCPVSGEKAVGAFVEYEGKRYELCCSACSEAFYKDPKRYLDQHQAKEAPQNSCMNVDLPCTA